MKYDNHPYKNAGGFQRYNNIDELSGALDDISANGKLGLDRVQDQVVSIIRERPWMSFRLSQINELYQRLDDVRRQGVEVSQQTLYDISNEAWRIGNEGSPDYDTPEASKRRDVR